MLGTRGGIAWRFLVWCLLVFGVGGEKAMRHIRPMMVSMYHCANHLQDVLANFHRVRRPSMACLENVSCCTLAREEVRGRWHVWLRSSVPIVAVGVVCESKMCCFRLSLWPREW